MVFISVTEIIPVTVDPHLPEDEVVKQNDWFSSIEKFSSAFKDDVMCWIKEKEHGPSPTQNDLVDEINDAMDLMSDFPLQEGLQDEVKPSDSISNVQSRRSAPSATSGKSYGSGKRSSVSGTSSARVVAEADLAALIARQKAFGGLACTGRGRAKNT